MSTIPMPASPPPSPLSHLTHVWLHPHAHPHVHAHPLTPIPQLPQSPQHSHHPQHPHPQVAQHPLHGPPQSWPGTPQPLSTGYFMWAASPAGMQPHGVMAPMSPGRMSAPATPPYHRGSGRRKTARTHRRHSETVWQSGAFNHGPNPTNNPMHLPPRAASGDKPVSIAEALLMIPHNPTPVSFFLVIFVD